MKSLIKPKVIDWRITGLCNDDCLYCYGPSKKTIPSVETINKINDKILSANIGIVRFSGGEPTLVKGFSSIIQKISKNGKSIVLSTNGAKYLENKDIIDLHIDKLNLPIDGYNEEIQAKCGHSANSFKKVVEILEGFKDVPPSFPIKIGTVLTKHNSSINNLKEIFSLLSHYHIDSWKIYQYIPEGENADINHCISTAHFNKLQTQLLESVNGTNLKIRFASQQSRSNAYFIIQPNGEVVIPCDTSNNMFEERVLGNILTDDFDLLFSSWSEIAIIENHNNNISLLEKNDEINEIEKVILFFIDQNPIASSTELKYFIDNFEHSSIETKDLSTLELEKIVGNLFEKGIIKNTIPVINVQALNYTVWLFQITCQQEIDNSIIDEIKLNDSVAWLVSMKSKNKAMGAIFSKTPLECQKVLKNIENVFYPYSIEIEKSAVTEKYVLGQRYLTIDDRVTDYMFDNSKVTHINKEIIISSEEKSVLESIDALNTLSLNSVAQKTNLSIREINKCLNQLKKKDVFLKFQPVFDHNKLGVKWFIVSMRLKSSSNIYDEFIDYLHSLTKVVHINCMIGYWDINFEVHASNILVVNKILDRCNDQFGDIIKEHCIDEIESEHKFNFLIKSVIQSL